MYCRNCGASVADQAVICVKCGVPPRNGRNFCPNCVSPTDPNAIVCTNCGISLALPVQAPPQFRAPAVAGQKSKMAAGLLGIFLGSLGVHNFYLGYTGKAVAQLLLSVFGWILSIVFIGVFMFMAAWIWGLVEGIMILTGSINRDARGYPLND